ncbi:uncharacterized protein I303_100759 [Kwoniella dejecticola CBS 10117]|uniref:Uncharacterized protein n=1 Tax=Kwoniella dejecticola CBS 10117 TaxID=1296121 RepID=A0A1A6AFY8_9TREE|nr:uncharacterized protein I303_00761 [Kwoniella dejecticola CBS 10117]OBR88943.1 hypothetical protein I303_00761 [Kwoniella dejecticola CBS 10117]
MSSSPALPFPAVPRTPHAIVTDKDISFEDNCVMVDSNPLSGTETEQAINDQRSYLANSRRRHDNPITVKNDSGTQQSGSDPISISGTGTAGGKEKPQLRRRLSLSGLVTISLPSPPIKLRALARRLSNSSPPSHTFQTTRSQRNKSSPASPIPTSPSTAVNPITPTTSSNPLIPKQSSTTMPSVPPINTSTVPSSPTCADCYPAIKHFWTGDLPSPEEEEESLRVDIKGSINGSMTALSSSVSSSTLTALDEDVVCSPPAYTRPQATPLGSSRRTPLMSRNSSFADDLTALSEVDESVHHDTDLMTPISPSAKSCSGVWLCSPPTVPSDEKSCVTPRFTSRPVNKTKNRPLVVRAMSTGRLSSEFDEDGRVICLSGHSDRVLRSGVSPPRSCGFSSRPALITSQSTPGLVRSKSYQVTRSKPIATPSLNTLPPLPARYTKEHQPSTERLVETPLTRTLSVGSWRKKAWSVGRSVRV